MSKKRLLIIPHSCLDTVLVRAQVLALKWAQDYDVYYLMWYRRKDNTFLGKAKEILFNLFQTRRYEKQGELTVARLRKWYWPFSFASHLNTKALQKLVDDAGIDIVVSAAMMYYDISKLKRVRVVYDAVDDLFEHSSGLFSPALEKRMSAFCYRQVLHADHVFAVTPILKQRLLEKLKVDPAVKPRDDRGEALSSCDDSAEILSSRGLTAGSIPRPSITVVPNGADIDAFRNVPQSEITAFRETHALQQKRVIGYIGNLRDSYTGLDFLLTFFKAAHKQFPDTVLLLVGPLEDQQQLAVNACDGVVWLGPLPPDHMPLVFASIDIGVLPFEKSNITNHCMPIKVLEYSAARKYVLATDLNGLRDMQLPNVHLLPREIKPWLQALEDLQGVHWDAAFDEAIAPYDWKNVAQTARRLLEGDPL